MNDLVASQNAFPRDFDHHYKILSQNKANLKSRSFNDWAKSLEDKFNRGREIRKQKL